MDCMTFSVLMLILWMCATTSKTLLRSRLSFFPSSRHNMSSFPCSRTLFFDSKKNEFGSRTSSPLSKMMTDEWKLKVVYENTINCILSRLRASRKKTWKIDVSIYVFTCPVHGILPSNVNKQFLVFSEEIFWFCSWNGLMIVELLSSSMSCLRGFPEMFSQRAPSSSSSTKEVTTD